jgi:hypothetical protein
MRNKAASTAENAILHVAANKPSDTVLNSTVYLAESVLVAIEQSSGSGFAHRNYPLNFARRLQKRFSDMYDERAECNCDENTVEWRR